MHGNFFQQARIGKYLSTLYSLSFFLIFPAVVINYYFGKHTIHVFMVLSLLVAIFHFRLYNSFYSNEKTLVKWTLLIFLYTVISGYLLHSPGPNSRYWPSIENQLNWLLPLLLLTSLYLGWIKIRLRDLKLIIALSAIAAGPCMFYNMIMGLHRLQMIHGHPIDFGDLSMLLGLFSLLFLIEEKGQRTKILYLAAFLCGLGASLYSGSRGGWIGLPMVAWLFWRWQFLSRRQWGIIIFCIVGFGLLIAFTDNSIKHRLLLINRDIQFWLEGNSETSIGHRFEMWKVALHGFAEHPVFGVGLGEFFAYKSSIIGVGDAPEYILRYKSPHNEYLNVLFSFGAIGFLAYTGFFVWLWRLFSQALSSIDADKRDAGRIGQLLLVAFADFCLSEVMLSNHLGGAIFFSTCALLVYFLNQDRIESNLKT